MRPLNRPMFRYGGPIKEGVMSGIREPKRSGGAMKAALVGNPVYPKTDGREHHGFVALAGVPTAFTAARAAAMRYLPRIFQGAKRMFGTTTPAKFTKGGPRVSGAVGSYTPVTFNPAKFNPNYLGRDPIIATGGKIIQGLTSPTSKGIIQKAGRIVLSPTGVATGLIYANGKFFNKAGEEVPPPNQNVTLGGKVGTSGAPGGGDPEMMGDGSWFAAQAEKEANIAKQKEFNNRIKKYRDIMDIKGMNKEAAYKSLIDASKLIQESGDFKGDIRSGKLINQVIQAASKQFDKPAKTSDAINTLILQNELKKDLNKEENALANLLKQKQIQIADKTLAGDTFEEIITERIKKGDAPTGSTLATILRATKGIDAKVIPSTKLGKGEDPVSFLTKEVAQAKKDGTLQPGAVVISNRVLIVDVQGNITPLL